MSDPKIPTSPVLPLRGMKCLGIAPAPLQIHICDREAIDAAMPARAIRRGAA